MKRLSILMLLLFVAIAVAACSASTANIKSATLGTGYDSTTQQVTGPTTTFTPADVFHCVIGVANAPEDTTVRTVWTAVEATDAAGAVLKDEKIEEATFTTKDIGSVVNASISLPNPWPIGKYKVDIYLDDKLDRTLEFTVAE
jgi:hypothetical protein